MEKLLGTKRGLGLRGRKYIYIYIYLYKIHYETSDKYSFNINKLSTKKKILNYCFLIQYNALIYEKGTWNFFKISKLFMIESILIVTTMSLSMNNIIAFDGPGTTPLGSLLVHKRSQETKESSHQSSSLPIFIGRRKCHWFINNGNMLHNCNKSPYR